jgi:hypothetical protein
MSEFRISDRETPPHLDEAFLSAEHDRTSCIPSNSLTDGIPRMPWNQNGNGKTSGILFIGASLAGVACEVSEKSRIISLFDSPFQCFNLRPHIITKVSWCRGYHMSLTPTRSPVRFRPSPHFSSHSTFFLLIIFLR